jgi:hypothetical protein
MPVYLKELKKELQSDRSKVGKDSDGTYRFTPPNIIGRLVKDYAKLKVSKQTSKAVPRLNWLTYTGLISSETTGIKYKVSIQFNDMAFKNIESKQFSVKTSSNTENLFHRVPSVQKNQVRIRCSCLDHAHRFSVQLAIFDALIGPPNRYTRKTGPWPIGRPLANSTDKIGFCKHVSSLLVHLQAKGLVKER